MKQLTLILVLIYIVLTGCTNNYDEQRQFEGDGYIIEVKGNRILVLERKYQDRTWKEVFNEYKGRAIWITTKSTKYKPGQKIYFWLDGAIDESYPEQATSKKIKIIEL